MTRLFFFLIVLSLTIINLGVKTIAITRATVAAPEGEVNIDIRSAESDESEQQQLANLNTDLDRTQEILSVEENYIGVYVDSQTIKDAATGFKELGTNIQNAGENLEKAFNAVDQRIDNILNGETEIPQDQQFLQYLEDNNISEETVKKATEVAKDIAQKLITGELSPEEVEAYIDEQAKLNCAGLTKSFFAKYNPLQLFIPTAHASSVCNPQSPHGFQITTEYVLKTLFVETPKDLGVSTLITTGEVVDLGTDAIYNLAPKTFGWLDEHIYDPTSEYVIQPVSEGVGFVVGKVVDRTFITVDFIVQENGYSERQIQQFGAFITDGLTAKEIEKLKTGANTVGLLVGGGAIATAAKNTRKTKANDNEVIYQHDYEYDPRIRKRALEDPTSHNFPYSFDDDILNTSPILKNNGYKIYRKEGTMNGRNGNFEIGVTRDGIIDHRFFRPTE